MAQYKFEGALENINEHQLEFINKVISEQCINVNKVLFKPVGQDGDNFAANVKRIIIDTETGSLQMIVKIAPSNEGLRQVLNTSILFTNEHIMYTQVLPRLEQLQIDANIPKEDRLRYAKCYGSFSEQPNEIILLEDLITSDFVMLDKFVSLKDDCVRSILKNFAILHSLCYVLKNREPETYDCFKQNLVDMWTVNAHDDKNWAHMQQFEDNISSFLDDESHKSTIKNKVTDILKHAVNFSKDVDGHKYSVIQQGDSWTNNMMFRFQGDQLLESIMIDYQASRNGNPVGDLMYMIFNCTDYEARAKNFYHWIDYYHSELDRSLSYFGLSASEVYPRDQLDADMKTYGPLMFGVCVTICNVWMRNPEEAGQVMEAMKKSDDLSDLMDTMKMDSLHVDTMKPLRERIIGLINSFNEFGLL